MVVDLGPGRSPADLDRPALLDAIHAVLVALRGALYTGCDLNSTLDDMHRLASRSPYILAAIGNPEVDPNAATAHGVVGALLAALRPDLARERILAEKETQRLERWLEKAVVAASMSSGP